MTIYSLEQYFTVLYLSISLSIVGFTDEQFFLLNFVHLTKLTAELYRLHDQK